MIDTKDAAYLADLVRRRAETRDAIIAASLGSNRYTVTLIDTGRSITAIAAQGTVLYPVGKRVVLRMNATGRALGRPPEIIGISQATDNGAIVGERPVAVNQDSPVITGLPAVPVVLVKGGLAVPRMIFGSRLAVAPTFGSVNIVHDSAAIVSGEGIRIFPRATSSCALGRYSLSIANETVTDFFEVVS